MLVLDENLTLNERPAMLVGGIVGWEEGQNDLFNPQSPRNRDDCLAPFRVLRSKAVERGIELHTLDVSAYIRYFGCDIVGRHIP